MSTILTDTNTDTCDSDEPPLSSEDRSDESAALLDQKLQEFDAAVQTLGLVAQCKNPYETNQNGKAEQHVYTLVKDVPGALDAYGQYCSTAEPNDFQEFCAVVAEPVKKAVSDLFAVVTDKEKCAALEHVIQSIADAHVIPHVLDIQRWAYGELCALQNAAA